MPSDDPSFRREMARVIRGGWHLIDLVSAVPERGDSLMVTLFGEPILVVREEDEDVRAYRCLRRPRGAPQPIRCEIRYGNIFVSLDTCDHQLIEAETITRSPRSAARTATATPRSA
ncbi:phenylpropionate dioxygenase-like ring-hydroxylating dioxygenase large terminal subunit [Streptomyces candidus]|uniref:Phenylpropionate dioxygenase-like ring-hydroxylating dioxygenase large terminal subunit n=2 Tax=Streptomyces candidus TaxID=67283 RepID=A0A7X0LS69_9ACTN|nr:phenylpropionate dioxygenase-like ring-hydroxylating dioxygenase large terminal subunit [Streptomyces candidus]GHH39116.1 hypothetical protein GCM10018773_18460 [Streptomyces candidus]